MSIIPLNKIHRDAVMKEAGIHYWYELAGYTVEFNEDQVEPERKGYEVVDGVKRVLRTLSLDFAWGELSVDDVVQTGLLGDVVEPDTAWYNELPEDFDEGLADLGRKAGLTKGELAVTAWVLEGNSVFNTDYAQRMGDSLGVTKKGASRAWEKARDKIIRVYS